MGGVLFEFVLHGLLLIIYGYATILGFRLVKKLYGGRFSSALPYFMMGICSLLAMILLHQIDLFFPVLDGSTSFVHGIEVLQLVAGIFFISALYRMYQARFATEGFVEAEK